MLSCCSHFYAFCFVGLRSVGKDFFQLRSQVNKPRTVSIIPEEAILSHQGQIHKTKKKFFSFEVSTVEVSMCTCLVKGVTDGVTVC